MRSSGRVRPTMAPLGFHALGDTVGGGTEARRNGSFLAVLGLKRGRFRVEREGIIWQKRNW